MMSAEEEQKKKKNGSKNSVISLEPMRFLWSEHQEEEKSFE